MRKLLLGLAIVLPTSLQAQVQKKIVPQKLQEQALEVEFNGRSSFPGFVNFNLSKSNLKIQNTEDISWAKEILPMRNSDNLIFKNKNVDDATQFTYYKYQQYYNNIPVEYAILNIKEKSNKLSSMMGDYYPNLQPTNSISLTKERALDFAKLAVPAKIYKWERKVEEMQMKEDLANPNFSFDPNTTLVILPVDKENGKEFRYAYKLDIFTHEPLSRYYVYIDAENGSLLKKISRICAIDTKGTANTKYHGMQTMYSDSIAPTNFILRENNRKNRGMKIETRNCQTNFESSSVDFVSTSKNWSMNNPAKDEAALDCHFAAGSTYDYYFDSLGHNSYDGNGSKLLQYMHYDVGYFNAFWTGSYSCYGDGEGDPLSSIDVVAHEITHGVTQYTADLVYELESGALNESFSDIFGTVVEFNALGSAASWVIGLRTFSLRNMSNPNYFNNPDTYGGKNWTPTKDCTPGGSNDGCGVHNNSGVQNFWFYVLSQGDTGINDLKNSYSVVGIGMDKAAKIAFRNLKFYLSPQSDYADARRGSILATIDLYGYNSPEMISVMNAWYAVGVGKPYSTLPQVEFKIDKPFCAPGSTLDFVNTSNSALSYKWDFGDGGTSTLENPSHTYNSLGMYTVRLIATNPNGSDTLTKVDYIKITNDAPVSSSCAAVTLSPRGTTGIYRVQLADIDNESPGPDLEDPYMDYTCSRTNLKRKATYPIKITTLNTAAVFTRVYIDWNNNGAFDVPAELVFSSNNTIQFHEGNVTVPDDAVMGVPLRMRVVSAKATNNTPDVVCSSLRNGQIEDYAVYATLASGIENNNIKSINVYPNPADNILNIVSGMDDQEVYLVDLFGKEILHTNFDKSTQLDITMLSSGVYILKIKSNDGIIVRKFEKK